MVLSMQELSTLSYNPYAWAVLSAIFLGLIIFDITVCQKKCPVFSYKVSLYWSLVWLVLSLVFALMLYVFESKEFALTFLTGYAIEKCLSIDNVMVMVLIFQVFRIPVELQHRVLFWGIIGALVFRAAMILLGATLLARYHWIIYVFGAFLIFTGIKMALHHQEMDFKESVFFRLIDRFLNTTPDLHGHSFFIKCSKTGKWLATPLFLALIFVEMTDVLFAVDSIPAIFAITQDPFIVFSANAFAILGLRSLFTLISGSLDRFIYLKFGLSVVLIYVGLKMMELIHIKSGYSLLIVVSIISTSVLISMYQTKSHD